MQIKLYIDHVGTTAGPFAAAWVPRVGETVFYPRTWTARIGSPPEIHSGKVIEVRHGIDHDKQTCTVVLEDPPM